MPGTKLSQAEKDLIGRWNQVKAFRLPCLTEIQIAGVGGIRGIKNLAINFDRPISVIVGESGVGKSTVLSLCRLSFNDIAEQENSDNHVNGDFERLFMFADAEQPFQDFQINWLYKNAMIPSVIFEGQSRQLSNNRPIKPVLYIGLARVVPSHEQPATVGHFQTNPTSQQIVPLSEDYRTRLSNILKKRYTEASSKHSAGFELRSCSQGEFYTSFNMSTAEDTLIQLFHLVQSAADETMIVIDNIEVGLSPGALTRLASNLIDICFKKKLQMIISTSSLDFVNAVPEEFVCLIESVGNKRIVTERASYGKIISVVSSIIQPDIVIFCEDTLVENLIRYTVTGDLRRRIKIIPAGSKNKLAQYAEFHLKSKLDQKIIVVWDGDVSLNEISGWINGLDLNETDKLKINRIKLPGSQPPERWIIEQLSNPEGYSLLANELREDENHAELFLTALATILEHHNVFRELAMATQLSEDDAASALTKAVANLSSHPLEILRQQIEMVANGKIITL